MLLRINGFNLICFVGEAIIFDAPLASKRFWSRSGGRENSVERTAQPSDPRFIFGVDVPKKVTHLVFLGLEILQRFLVRLDFDRHALDLEARDFQRGDLVRVI